MSEPKKTRILIVDDEPAHVRALCDTLADQGYEPVGFADGPSALAALRQGMFELILADLMMPGMDGIALLHAAQRIDPNLVGIIMTGEGTIATAVDAMKTGALDYILKPFMLSVILPVLARALAVRHLRLEVAALERSVRERTIELEASNKELEAFSYSVSHDLRAPLTVIIGSLDAAIEDHRGQMPAKAVERLNAALEGAEHMNRLIDDLLRLARLGRQPLSKQRVDIAGLVHEIVDELQKDSGGRHIEIRIGELAEATGDPALLRQVFVNLLSNAFKFTRGREPAVVEVNSRRSAGEIVYEVRDNGAGFDMQHAKELFAAFQRLHTPKEFEGTGVGLSIAHRIVTRHGGRIWAEAERGKGATFHVSLPL